MKHIIVWPQKKDYPRIAREFDNIGRYFPKVLGAIDSCHLPIELHEEDATNYRNYKSFNSIHLLAVALADLRFSFVYTGFPGRYYFDFALTLIFFLCHITSFIN